MTKTTVILDEWLERSLIVTIKGDLRVCRDPDDDKILECAVKPNAALAVTGDQDLLVLDPFKGIRIFTANAYVRGLPGSALSGRLGL